MHPLRDQHRARAIPVPDMHTCLPRTLHEKKGPTPRQRVHQGATSGKHQHRLVMQRMCECLFVCRQRQWWWVGEQAREWGGADNGDGGNRGNALILNFLLANLPLRQAITNIDQSFNFQKEAALVVVGEGVSGVIFVCRKCLHNSTVNKYEKSYC